LSNGSAGTKTVESQVPARLDRLPFSRWHWLAIAALGITWILDGLEVTMVGNVAAVLTDPRSGLGLSGGQIGLPVASTSPGPARGRSSSPTSRTALGARSCS
jgi:hypothetical protein